MINTEANTYNVFQTSFYQNYALLARCSRQVKVHGIVGPDEIDWAGGLDLIAGYPS